jgi:hypothetical protein
MLRFEITPDDLLHTRFALSPLFELDGLLRQLSGMAGRQRLPAEWRARLGPVFQRLRRETELDAVLALFSPRYGPRGSAKSGLSQVGPVMVVDSWAGMVR